MAEHETCLGASDEWYTPREIFDALGLTFDLDPCSPGAGHWVPARKVYTKADDGLVRPWAGITFVNPPFGGRNGHVPWLRRFFDHGNGIAIVRAYTSSGWFHEEVVPRAEALLFPRGKTKFVRPDGTVGKAPGHGVVLIGAGAVACDALRQSKLGLFVTLDKTHNLRHCYPTDNGEHRCPRSRPRPNSRNGWRRPRRPAPACSSRLPTA